MGSVDNQVAQAQQPPVQCEVARAAEADAERKRPLDTAQEDAQTESGAQSKRLRSESEVSAETVAESVVETDAETAAEAQAEGEKVDLASVPVFNEASYFNTFKQEEFDNNTPFRHIIVNDFLTPEIAAKLRVELLKNLEVKPKETDLFKFHQSGDISAILADEEKAKNLPVLSRFVKEFYSESFRKTLSEKFGCGELIDRVDMAAQAYTQGCHLMTHDDVISTRKLTFVMYLHDPEESEWEACEGGAMEMYGKDASVPEKCLLPNFNVALFFGVEPNASYHAVSEIVGDRVRLSLQGWFHVASLEETYSYDARDCATLQQVLAKAKSENESENRANSENNENSADAKAEAQTEAESDVDLAELISAEYLTEEGKSQLRQHYIENSEVFLSRFLKEDVAAELLQNLTQMDASEVSEKVADKEPVSYQSGSSEAGCEGWEIQGPVHMQRYLSYTGKKSASEKEAVSPHKAVGEKLLEVQALLRSQSFKKFLAEITSLEVEDCRSSEVRRFRRGLDYTIATMHSLCPSAVLDVTFMCVDDTTADKAYCWDSENVGGFESYNETEEGGDADAKAEVYQENADGPLLNIPPQMNALSIVQRDAATVSFVKYVNMSAPSSRIDVKCVWNVNEDSLPDLDLGSEEEEDAE